MLIMPQTLVYQLSQAKKDTPSCDRIIALLARQLNTPQAMSNDKGLAIWQWICLILA